MTHEPGHGLGPWTRFGQAFGRLASDRVRGLSLVEQGLLSGANFLALLAYARAFEAADFGTFSFAWLTLQFVLNIHRSAVVVPFVIHTAQPGRLEAEAPAWRRLNLITTALAASGLAVAGATLPLLGLPAWIGLAFLLAALFVVPSFVYEFKRRWLIQTDRYGLAVLAAAIYCSIQLAGIVAVLLTQSLWAAAAAFTLSNLGAALACALATPKMAPPAKPPAFRPFLRNLAHFISWSVMSNLAYNGYGHIPPLILGAMAGPVPVAVFTAIRNFTQPLSTLITAIDNFDKPRAARALASEGPPGLKRELTNTALALAGFTLPYLAMLVIFGDTIVPWVYGKSYGDPTWALAWFAAAHIAIVIAYPLETSLFLLRRPDLLFFGRIVAATIGIALCVLLVPQWGIYGALAGITGGILASSLAAAWLLARLQPWRNPR